MKENVGVIFYLTYHFLSILKNKAQRNILLIWSTNLLFGRHPKVPQEINKIGDENNNLNNDNYNISDTVIDNISTDLNLRAKIKKQVLYNISIIQSKQKKRYEMLKRKNNKSYVIKKGDKVLRRNLKIISKYGKKTEPLWIGLYQVYDIDQRNRIILRDIKTEKILKRKFSYLHITKLMIL